MKILVMMTKQVKMTKSDHSLWTMDHGNIIICFVRCSAMVHGLLSMDKKETLSPPDPYKAYY